jgi:Domain of unknown function (DUF4130
MDEKLAGKLRILADDAKYDVSCASSGAPKGAGRDGLGSTSNGICHADAPGEDAFEAGWRGYYESTFNPARVNPDLMRAHMPKKYWQNLPETAAIPASSEVPPRAFPRCWSRSRRCRRNAPRRRRSRRCATARSSRWRSSTGS